MEKLEGTSMNIVQDNIEKLKEIFPEIFTEGKIDFEVLKQLLGEKIETNKERYSFTWNGKAEARQIAQDTSTGTLRPSKEDSKDWDNTENLYIEGDNLEVLKLLQKSYHGKIKMIYMDPPYNTGKDFVYKDNFKDNLKNYLKLTGQLGEDGQKLSTNSNSSGRYHSDWLNMMYPRLKLARNLLTDDGVIFISIDDNEVINLKKICDEIFGEENFIATLPTIMNLKGNNDQFAFAGTHEYTIVYGKNILETKIYELYIKDDELEEWKEDEYGLYKKGANLKATGINAPREKRPNLYFPLFINENLDVSLGKKENYKEIYPITDGKEMSWRWSKEKFKNELHNLIISKTEEGISIYKKQRAEDNERPTKKPKSIFIKPEYSSGNGTNVIKEIFKDKVFSFPKPLELIKDFLTISTRKEDIVIDFFSGSATTAHAIMELNKEDCGARKYIAVQLPEICDEKTEAYKLGYKTICEIGKERIRRAGEKIKEELEKENSQLKLGEEPKKLPDIGFKVFKLDSSNIKEWDSETEDLKQSLFDSIDNIKSDRTSLDVLYEILLKYGLDLNVPIEENKNFYSIGGGTLLVNLNKEIDMEVIDLMCEEYRNLLEIDEDFKTTVVLRDSAFKNDVDKTNAMKKLEQSGIKEVRSI